MGNQMSLNSKEEKSGQVVKLNQEYVEQNLAFQENYSSFKGVKTDTHTSKKSRSSSKESIQTTDKTNDNDLKVLTPFEWRNGGQVVYITGSFSNWTQWFIMRRNDNGIFQLSLELPRGVHQFKFIVDNKWLFSKHLPTCSDGRGNTNNVIDNTNFQKVTKPKEEIQKTKEEKKTKPSNRTVDDFSEYFPTKSEMNTEAPTVPYHYKRSFNLDNATFQQNIGDQSHLVFKKFKFFNENDSFKSITVPPHVILYIAY